MASSLGEGRSHLTPDFKKGADGGSEVKGSTQGKLTLGDLGQVTFSLGLQFPRASQVGFSALLRWLGASGASCWL